MSTTKRIIGDYTIDATGDVNITGSGNVSIAGNLFVSGTTTTVNSSDTEIADRLITLNKGEVGAGVTGIYSGLEVDRGSLDNVALRWNDTSDLWELTLDGTSYAAIITTDTLPPAGLDEIIYDTTPQLGGDLDVNGFSITSASNGDVVITADGTGLLKLNKDISLQDQASAPSSTAGYNKLYSSATQGGGGSGLYYVNTTTNDELVSRTKALAYSLIF